MGLNMIDPYVIYLDPDHHPDEHQFTTTWNLSYGHRRGVNKTQLLRIALEKEVNQWCFESFGSNAPEVFSERRWTRYMGAKWKIHSPEDAILFKLRWCHSVPWFTPEKWSLERQEMRRKVWEGYDPTINDW